MPAVIEPDGMAIKARFFAVLQELVRLKRLRGVKGFARLYGVDESNLIRLKRAGNTGKIDPVLLNWLCVGADANGVPWRVNGHWLLTGRGSMFLD